MRETWYVLEDGSVADPRDCALDQDGVLCHMDGRKVAKRGADAYSSRSVETDDFKTKDITPEPAKSGYKTRASKAEK